MLFSREDVSNFINQNFEPAWEMVRPVPIVRIDFGNGNETTRTLHGNIASYVCGADGKIADILPGIYTPAAYTSALQGPRDLAVALRRLEPADKLAQWRQHHQQKAQLLRRTAQQALLAAQIRIPDVGKGRIELPIERHVRRPIIEAAPAPRPRNAAELAAWQPLATDTQRNETERRLLIHDRFATSDLVRPEQIKRWLYRDVLHADIDDPHLGLGDDFFADVER